MDFTLRFISLWDTSQTIIRLYLFAANIHLVSRSSSFLIYNLCGIILQYLYIIIVSFCCHGTLNSRQQSFMHCLSADCRFRYVSVWQLLFPAFCPLVQETQQVSLRCRKTMMRMSKKALPVQCFWWQ